MRLGTTTFSFTNEWLAGSVSLAQMLGRVGREGLGPGVELVGYQAWREFPRLTRDEVLAFRRLADRHDLEPTALGGYADLMRRVDRLMTTDEAIAFLSPQIEAARSLGFPIVRLHAGIPADVLERLVPAAEAGGVTLATEIQGGQTPDSAAVSSILELRERLDTSAIALVLDASVSMNAVPGAFRDAAVRAGATPDQVEELASLWALDTPMPELFDRLAALDLTDVARVELQSGFVRFGRQDPHVWAPLVSAIAYVHAKFWEVDAAGSDPSVRTPDLLAVLGEGGFDGVVAVEWGGSAWLDADEVDAFDLVARHGSFCKAVISNGVPEVATRT